MKHSGIHMPQSIDTPEPFIKSPDIVCAPISMSAPPKANAIAMVVTVLSLRFANPSIVSWSGAFIQRYFRGYGS